MKKVIQGEDQIAKVIFSHIVVGIGQVDCLTGAGFFTEPAENTTAEINIKAHRILFDAGVGMLARLDVDTLCRAGSRTHIAGDAFRGTILPLCKDVQTAVAVVVGELFLRVSDRYAPPPTGDPPPHIGKEDCACNRQPVEDLGEIEPFPKPDLLSGIHNPDLPVRIGGEDDLMGSGVQARLLYEDLKGEVL